MAGSSCTGLPFFSLSSYTMTCFFLPLTCQVHYISSSDIANSKVLEKLWILHRFLNLLSLATLYSLVSLARLVRTGPISKTFGCTNTLKRDVLFAVLFPFVCMIIYFGLNMLIMIVDFTALHSLLDDANSK